MTSDGRFVILSYLVTHLESPMDPVSRAQAASAGATHFFTGRPCKNGHVALRYVSTGNCTACQSLYSKRFRGDDATVGFVPAQRMHPDDAEQVLKFIDHLNAARGLPPATRPGAMPVLPSEFEMYLAKELRKPLSMRPPLQDIERAAGVLGMKVEYRTTTRPVDTWSRPLVLPDITARKAAMAQSLAADGYLPDERPTT